jgi:uncharacterized membrane protein YjjP (DUF1212 family)
MDAILFLIPWQAALLGVGFIIFTGIIGSLWQRSTARHSAVEEWTYGVMAMLIAFPAFLFLANRLLGWQITRPTLVVALILFLLGGLIMSKNLRNQ